MEYRVVVKFLIHVTEEILHGKRSGAFVKLGFDSAHARFNDHNVAAGRIGGLRFRGRSFFRLPFAGNQEKGDDEKGKEFHDNEGLLGAGDRLDGDGFSG